MGLRTLDCPTVPSNRENDLDFTPVPDISCEGTLIVVTGEFLAKEINLAGTPGPRNT